MCVLMMVMLALLRIRTTYQDPLAVSLRNAFNDNILMGEGWDYDQDIIEVTELPETGAHRIYHTNRVFYFMIRWTSAYYGYSPQPA